MATTKKTETKRSGARCCSSKNSDNVQASKSTKSTRTQSKKNGATK